MNSNQVESLIREAITALFLPQTGFWDFTSAPNQIEWNIAHRLANELHALLGHYDCDLDVSKPISTGNVPTSSFIVAAATVTTSW